MRISALLLLAATPATALLQIAAPQICMVWPVAPRGIWNCIYAPTETRRLRGWSGTRGGFESIDGAWIRPRGDGFCDIAYLKEDQLVDVRAVECIPEIFDATYYAHITVLAAWAEFLLVLDEQRREASAADINRKLSRMDKNKLAHCRWLHRQLLALLHENAKVSMVLAEPAMKTGKRFCGGEPEINDVFHKLHRVAREMIEYDTEESE